MRKERRPDLATLDRSRPGWIPIVESAASLEGPVKSPEDRPLSRVERIATIDTLRGLAALGVVLFHYVGLIPLMKVPVGGPGAAVVALTRFGYLGVPIFFVLSGYVIAMTAARCSFTAETGARFVARRLVRIIPPYWAMIGLISASLVAGRAVGLFRNTTVTPGQFAAHLAYIQNILGFPALDLAYWTLCLEVQFYLVFAVFALCLRGLTPGSQTAWFAGLTAASLVIEVFNAAPEAWFPLWWYQFGVGVLAYRALGERSARILLSMILLALVALGATRGQASDWTVAVAAVLLVATGLGKAQWLPVAPKAVLALGRISYSLYLVHGFIGLGLAVCFRSSLVRSETSAWVAITSATIAAVGFAAVFYLLVESQGIKWSRRVRVNPDRV